MDKKRVLLIRLSSLGDVIFNLPLANVLKNNGYEVTWLVGEKGIDIVKNNPAVDEAILVPIEKWKKQSIWKNLPEYINMIKHLRSEKFDIALDTHMLLKSFIWLAFCGAKRRIISKSAREFSILGGNEFIDKISIDFNTHVIQNYLKYAEYLGLNTSAITAELPPAEEETIQKIDNLLKDIDRTKPVIVIAPATTWTAKHWNKENWKQLIEKLGKEYTLIFTGTTKDNELINYISSGKHLNIAGKTKIPELAEVFRRCDLVISLDSGSTHLAWASQKPKIVSIFCCTPTGLYAPIGSDDKYIALSGHISCQPCHRRRCHLSENKNACTALPSVDEVLNAVHRLLPQGVKND